MRNVNVLKGNGRNLLGIAELTQKRNVCIDIVDVINAHQGVNLQYVPVPPSSSWIKSMVKTFASAAIGLIPGVGPLMAFSFELAWQAIEDPDAFRRDPLGLGADLVVAIIQTGAGMKDNVRPGMGGKRSLTAQGMDEENEKFAQAMKELGTEDAGEPLDRGEEPQYTPLGDTTESVDDEYQLETIVVTPAPEGFVDPTRQELVDFSGRGGWNDYKNE
jgi:hypothetical protein